MFLCTLPLTNVSRITLLHHVILREHEFFKFSEHERSTYVYPHFFLFFSTNYIELPRFLDRTRATASSGCSRNYQTPRTKAGSGKSRYVFRSCAFSDPFARSRQPALPRPIPVPLSRENTKQGTCS